MVPASLIMWFPLAPLAGGYDPSSEISKLPRVCSVTWRMQGGGVMPGRLLVVGGGRDKRMLQGVSIFTGWIPWGGCCFPLFSVSQFWSWLLPPLPLAYGQWGVLVSGNIYIQVRAMMKRTEDGKERSVWSLVLQSLLKILHSLWGFME